MGSAESACGHTYFGLHRTEAGWTFREWAPNATAIHQVGKFSEWNADPSFALTRLNDGGDWDSHCFDYAKLEVVHFLLSNCRYWFDAFHVDGFGFDGITSMLYTHHGLEKAFGGYDDYFDIAVDEDALAYLVLASEVIHTVRPDAMIVAEDISGMPGLALPQEHGGIGFGYRFSMGVPDYWIKLTKDTPDERWPMGRMWQELTNRRREERTIS